MNGTEDTYMNEVQEDATARAIATAVHMNAVDFGRLCKDYEDRDPGTLARGRFWAGPDREVDGEWEWKRVYWFGENYAALLLARAYALSRGLRCEVLYDNSSYRGDGPVRGWCVLSDYEEQR